MDTPDVIKIRAHHLLCIQGFQGYGYNKDFANNMAKVVKYLKTQKPAVETIVECDIICSKCPHNKENECSKNTNSAAETKKMDMKVLKKLGLNKGEKINFNDILSLIKTKLKKQDIEDICASCSWKNKCLFIMSYEDL